MGEDPLDLRFGSVQCVMLAGWLQELDLTRGTLGQALSQLQAVVDQRKKV